MSTENSNGINEILTTDQVSKLLGVSKGYVYKLCHYKKIPYYKPGGGRVYFDRAEVLDYIKNSRVATKEEISEQASKYCMRKGGAV